MVVGGRRTSIAVFITLGAGLIAFIVLLYVGWVLLGWRDGILLFFGRGSQHYVSSPRSTPQRPARRFH
jgi:hypothetical protein